MSLFSNYLGLCPCFSTQLSKSQFLYETQLYYNWVTKSSNSVSHIMNV